MSNRSSRAQDLAKSEKGRRLRPLVEAKVKKDDEFSFLSPQDSIAPSQKYSEQCEAHLGRAFGYMKAMKSPLERISGMCCANNVEEESCGDSCKNKTSMDKCMKGATGMRDKAMQELKSAMTKYMKAVQSED